MGKTQIHIKKRGTNNKYIELVFCVLNRFPWDKLHRNLTVSLHGINCISSVTFVFMFIGDILEMDRDKAFTHYLSQICIRTSNETRKSNATHTPIETPSNVHS